MALQLTLPFDDLEGLGEFAPRGTMPTYLDVYGKPLPKQHQELYYVLRSGAWYTLKDLHAITGIKVQSISARLRDFRKARFGWHTVERVDAGHRVFKYRLRPREVELGKKVTI